MRQNWYQTGQAIVKLIFGEKGFFGYSTIATQEFTQQGRQKCFSELFFVICRFPCQKNLFFFWYCSNSFFLIIRFWIQNRKSCMLLVFFLNQWHTRRIIIGMLRDHLLYLIRYFPLYFNLNICQNVCSLKNDGIESVASISIVVF